MEPPEAMVRLLDPRVIVPDESVRVLFIVALLFKVRPFALLMIRVGIEERNSAPVL
jgi:hypothetical protein